MFGQSVSLLINKQPQNNTVIGGFVSLFVKLLMLIYITILVKALMLYEKDDNLTILKINDDGSKNEVSYKDMHY